MKPRYKNNQVKIIACGNIVVGGSGKTPLVSWLIDFSKSYNLNPAVLARGYGRITKEPQYLGNHAEIKTWDNYGDENFLLFQRHAVKVYIDNNRYRSAKKAGLENNLLILDDGFQTMNIKKNIDLVLFDAGIDQKNLKPFPQGILREPLVSIKRSTAILLTKINLTETKKIDSLKNILVAAAPEIPIFEADFIATSLVDKNYNEHSLNLIKGKTINIIAGIARPESFIATIKLLNVTIKNQYFFKDHHIYNKNLLEGMVKSESGSIWLTTEKDYVRLQKYNHMFNQLYYIKMDLVPKKEFQSFIKHLLIDKKIAKKQ